MLEVSAVSLAQGKTDILKNVSFIVKPGEIVAILGVSGAGKSSLFKLLIGEKKTTTGSIKIDQFNLSELSATSLQKYRQQIGIVFQDFRLLPKKTVAQNIAYALEVCGEESLIPKKVPALLEMVGLGKKSADFPATLSGGESQRTAIARALIHDPKILIADEATGNLDPQTSREIAELFRALNEKHGKTVIFSTHDPVMIKALQPRVIRLEAGRILFDKPDCSVADAFAGIL